MKCHYDRVEDMQFYMSGGVFRYDGKAVYVFDALKGKKGPELTIAPVEDTNASFKIDAYDDLFDASFPDLGYVNQQSDKNGKKAKRVFFIAKRFNRQFNHGLTEKNTSCLDIEGKPLGYVGSYLLNQSFQDLIQNKYPSLEDAWGLLKEDGEVAISRDVALKSLRDSGLVLVFYKMTNVGWVSPGSNVVIVPTSEMAWLVSKHLGDFAWEIQ